MPAWKQVHPGLQMNQGADTIYKPAPSEDFSFHIVQYNKAEFYTGIGVTSIPLHF